MTGFEIAFGIGAGASFAAAVVAVFVTPRRGIRRRELAVATAGRD